MIEQIEALAQKLAEKEAEILSLKRELSALADKADRLIMEQEQAEQASVEEVREESPVAEPLAEEVPTAEAEKLQPDTVEEPPAPAETISPATHNAIMRTIENLSKDFSAARGESPEQRFKSKPTLVDKVARQPLKDLKGSMGINERFLYANELFHGDMGAFTRAVEELNHLESEQDAERLLNEELAAKYKWNDESDAVTAFKSLVSRRFA